jgi:hypothetical protein
MEITDIALILGKMYDEMEALHQKWLDLQDARVKWVQENAKQIKPLMPKKGGIYEIIDRDKIPGLRLSFKDAQAPNGRLFARILNNAVAPLYLLRSYDKCLTVTCDICDEELNKLDIYQTSVGIDNLKPVEKLENEKINEPTKVYVMIDEHTGAYKIGRSKNPKIREKTLQSEKPFIRLLFAFDGINEHERQLHEMFKEKRIRGEWFDLSYSDIVKIKQFFGVEDDL